MGTIRTAVVALGVLAGVASAQPVRVEVVRDTWVTSIGRQVDANNGGGTKLKTKGVQEFFLLDIDPASLRGRVVTGATLHVNVASKDVQRRLSVSTLPAEWAEGTGASYAVQRGSATFRFAKHEERPWTFPGSDITAVINGMGNSLWGFAEPTTPDKDGWQVVAVRPDVVAARVAGISQGFAVMDDVGSEYTRDGEKFAYHPFPNRFIHSRESGRRTAPYMTVTLGAKDDQPPGAASGIAVIPTELPPGEVLVTWNTPADAGPAGTIGFIARYVPAAATGNQQLTTGNSAPFDWESATPLPQYLVPVAGAAGSAVKMHLRDIELPAGGRITLGIRAIDRAGNIGPAAMATIATSAAPATIDIPPAKVRPFADDAPLPTIAGVRVAVVDALDKIHPATGQLIPARPAGYLQANHLWSAAQKTIRLHAARNEFVDFQFILSGAAKDLSATLAFDDPAIQPALFRFRHVETPAGPLPDPLVPLAGTITIPAADESIAAQRHAPFLAEVYVPHTAKPGPHTGTLTLRQGEQTLALKVSLTVWNFTLADHLSFIPEMNCYGLPDSPAELAYYRMAHAHRTVLNRLAYSWRGQVHKDCAPTWNGKTFDFSRWDKRYGPLFDGSAFADLPRKGVPIEAFYLPLNENWPLSIEEGFTGGYWADAALTAEYQDAFADACGQFAAHIAKNGWNQTLFEFYLNNKVYYKKDGWSRSSAPWILDEPSNTQDFWALRQYGMLFHRGVTPHRGEAILAYRCDISRPQWQRDLLDGLLDVNIVGGSFREYQRAVIGRKQAHREVTINYGSSNPIDRPNIQPAAWCIDTWTLGGDGVLPWSTVGKESSWKSADELSLFYPGAPAGSAGPIASARLKSYRRGQQDVEYLTMLQQTLGVPRFAVASAVRGSLKLSATVEKKNEDDAGLVDYRDVDAGALWELRMRIGQLLDAASPPARRQWIDFRPPVRDVSKLPALGQFGS